MTSIDRYVFRASFAAFALVLVSLTAVIWVTQILRQIDLITGQGQTVLTFLSISSMIIPSLVMVLAPIAMMIALVHVLTKLNNDSELVVMSAAGLSPRRLFLPVLALAVLTAVMVAVIAAWVSPMSQRAMNDRLMKARTDLVANIVRPGTFVRIDSDLTFHIREKRSDAEFSGIVVDDFRNKQERFTIIAEHGTIVQQSRGTFLVMTDGWAHRRRPSDRDPTFIKFERHVFDLSPYTAAGQVSYGLRERYLWELIWPAADDRLLQRAPNQFRAEMHDRLLSPFYAIAFAVVGYAMLCLPRTTRQGRMFSIGTVVVGVFVLRIGGFALMAVAQSVPVVAWLVYPLLMGTIGVGVYAIYTGRGLDFEDRIDMAGLRDRLSARFGKFAWR